MSSNDKTISFEQMPMALVELSEKVDRLSQLVESKLAGISERSQGDEWMNLEQLIEYLPDHPSKPTVYGWVCNRMIPFHKNTKKLSFLKSEIDAWMADSGHKTAKEIQSDALERYGYVKGGRR